MVLFVGAYSGLAALPLGGNLRLPREPQAVELAKDLIAADGWLDLYMFAIYTY